MRSTLTDLRSGSWSNNWTKQPAPQSGTRELLHSASLLTINAQRSRLQPPRSMLGFVVLYLPRSNPERRSMSEAQTWPIVSRIAVISDKDSLARTLKSQFLDASSVYNVKLAAWTICGLRRRYVVSKGQDNTRRLELFGIIIPTDVG